MQQQAIHQTGLQMQIYVSLYFMHRFFLLLFHGEKSRRKVDVPANFFHQIYNNQPEATPGDGQRWLYNHDEVAHSSSSSTCLSTRFEENATAETGLDDGEEAQEVER
jgi:hypothetical protein